MVTSRTDKVNIGRDTVVFWAYRRWSPHTEGVALVLTAEAQRSLICWEPVSSRIITAKFTTKKKNISLHVIQCYAPTNDVEEEKKDDFYQQLQAVLDKKRERETSLFSWETSMRNVKVEADNAGYEDITGKHGLGQMNENGERFSDL